MRILTNAERIERARIHLSIMEAKLAIAEDRAVLAQSDATRKVAAARKAQDTAICATNKALRLEQEVEHALNALDALTK